MRVKLVALCGIFLAFSVAILFLASNLPGLELSAMCLAAFPIYILHRQFGGIAGLIFYTASVGLSLLIVPNKMGIIIYIVIIGPFIAIKSIIETSLKINNEPAQKKRKILIILIKIFVISGLANLCALLFKAAFMSGVVWENLTKLLPVPLVLAGFFSVYLLLADFMMQLVYNMLERTNIFRSLK
jgi:hypothetical protein